MTETTLSIMVHRDIDSGEWYLDRVESSRNNIRTQTRFGTPYSVRMAFTPQFAEFVMGLLPVGTEPSALSIDNKTLPEISLTLQGLRITAQRAIAGLQSVTIRAQKVAGCVGYIYAPAVMPELVEPVPAKRLN